MPGIGGSPDPVVPYNAFIVAWQTKELLKRFGGRDDFSIFIGVGVLSALIVLALKNHEPYAGYAIALAVMAPLSGILHWLESWIAHDMAFRLLAEMRIDAFRKLERVNVEGTLNDLAEAARHFKTQNTGGDIVLVSTKNVFAPGAKFGAYSATKAAAQSDAAPAKSQEKDKDKKDNDKDKE